MRLITRLAWRNLTARRGQAMLLLLALSLATTTVTMALSVKDTGNNAWDRLHRATNGFHVRAGLPYRPDVVAPTMAQTPAPTSADVMRTHEQLTALATARGVVAASGPWPTLYATGSVGGAQLDLSLQVRDSAPAAAGQPLVTSGRWLDDASEGVVLEDGLASVLHIRPGNAVTIASRQFVVNGTAMTVSVGRYPLHQPATIWVSSSTADMLRAAGAIDVFATVELRMAKPEDAAAFVATQISRAPDPPRGAWLETWQRARAGAHDELTFFALALLTIATLLAGLTIATAAVLVAGRMAAQGRQVGTLKAVGVTPGQVTCVLLVEYLAVATTAAVIGIVSGTLLSPLVVRSAASLYGAPAAPPITWPRMIAAISVAVAVVVLATVGPALRGVRHSTVRSLAADVRPPSRPSRLARFAGTAGLPLPAVLGLRTVMRRPGRTAANAMGLAFGIAMVIIGLALYQGTQHFLATNLRSEAEVADRAVTDALVNQLLTVVFGGSALLMALAAVNAFIVAVFAARDAARNHAILRTLGATPRQTVASFLVAQLGACFFACALGIPLGALLFNSFAGQDLAPIRLSALIYAAVVIATPALYALNVIAPARLMARRPITPHLTYE